MRVSIITPSRNSEKYLRDCLDSIRVQDYPDIEHIVVDGNSTDGTLDIIQEYNGTISKWVSEPDNGMYDAINKGIKLATGDVIGVLNSDDVFADGQVVSALVAQLEKTGADSVFGDLYYVYARNKDRVYRKWKGGEYDKRKFARGWMPAHPTFYVRKKAIAEYGLYETHFRSAADYELMCRLLYKHGVSSCYLPKVMVLMRTGGASNNNIKHRLWANRRDFLAMKKNGIKAPFLVSVLKPVLKLHQYEWRSKIAFFFSFLN